MFLSCYSHEEVRSVAVTPQSTKPTAHTTPPDGLVPASLPRRFAALLVDWILCLLAAGLFAHLMTDGSAPVLVLIAEYAFFLGLFGQTPGMWLAGLRCVSVATGNPIGLFRAALRGALLCLAVPAMIMDGQRRGLHDRAAGSIVVQVR
jgi:uncharacterized RDD family membrane protein YckC